MLSYTGPSVWRMQAASVSDGTHPEVYRCILYILTRTLGASCTSRYPHGDLIAFSYESNRLRMHLAPTPLHALSIPLNRLRSLRRLEIVFRPTTILTVTTIKDIRHASSFPVAQPFEKGQRTSSQ